MHETSTTELLRWIVLLPLLGAMLNGLLNKRLPERVVSSIAIGSILASFFLSVKVFLDLRVKVLKEWQKDPKALERLGF